MTDTRLGTKGEVIDQSVIWPFIGNVKLKFIVIIEKMLDVKIKGVARGHIAMTGRNNLDYLA